MSILVLGKIRMLFRELWSLIEREKEKKKKKKKISVRFRKRLRACLVVELVLFRPGLSETD